jgi:hypothetical protein
VREVAAALAVTIGLAFAPEAQAAIYTIPDSIPGGCSVNVTQSIRTWLASVPDGSTAQFRRRCYRVDGTLQLNGRRSLVLAGNEATFRAMTLGGSHRAHWRFVGGENLTIRNMTIRGGNPDPGHHVYDLQWQHGIDLQGVKGIEIQGVNIVNPLGDCIYVGNSYPGGVSRWTSDARVSLGSCRGPGRMGVAVTAGRNVLVQRVAFENVAIFVFDVEPDGAGAGAEDVTFQYNHAKAPIGYYALAAMLGNGPVDGITVHENTVSGAGMRMVFRAFNSERRSNITVTGNTADTGWNWPGAESILFRRIDGATVTQNTIPLSGSNMALVSAQESCAINVFGNSYPGGVAEARIAPYPCP